MLVGDFILARATQRNIRIYFQDLYLEILVLCLIAKPSVISTMAEIVQDLVKGELMQLEQTGFFISV